MINLVLETGLDGKDHVTTQHIEVPPCEDGCEQRSYAFPYCKKCCSDLGETAVGAKDPVLVSLRDSVTAVGNVLRDTRNKAPRNDEAVAAAEELFKCCAMAVYKYDDFMRIQRKVAKEGEEK